MKNTIYLLAMAAAFVLNSCSTAITADRIYINAKIWTGDTSNERATAIAIKDSIILFVGLDYEKFKGSQTQMIDLGGKMMVPGFIDNHTHFLGGGYQLASVNLRYVNTPAAFIAGLKDYASKFKDDRWIAGGDWDHENWGGTLPRKDWIDSITGTHPLFINRYDGHMVLVNSIVLKLAGIDKNTPNPANGQIVRDAKTGEPTGILKDGAMDLISAVMPNPSEKILDECLQRAMRHAFEHGVTQVADMGIYGGWADLETYRRALANKQLDLRIYSFVPLSSWPRLDSFVKKNGTGNDILRWGGVKGFVDGSLGSTTAWFFKPYLDAPASTGLQLTDTVILRQWLLAADSAGLHIATHAIGDHAIHWLLNVYQEAEEKRHTDHRFRIEHAQHLLQTDIPRFAALKIIPSMQPYHAIDDGKWAGKRLDSARLKGTYAFNDLIKSGARVTFGSDWTVAPLDPIAGIYAAVTRSTLDNKNPDGWFPDQKVSVESALRCYTSNNAYANFMENKTGQLKAGMLADMVVLSEDLFANKPANIQSVKVLRTIVNGKEVFNGK